MGNEMSGPYEGPTDVLEDRDISSIARYMTSELCRKIFVMLGAGVSTAAGIPDFRSPGTGLYSNLEKLNLPYPEAVFEIKYFRQNPIPFYTLARELYPGKFRPTLSHTFVKLLADHAYLDTCFTQNIDTLERQANVPGERIVEAHGSFADQRCIDCHEAFDGAKMRAAVEKAEIARCGECGGLVKPDIVFFGESLPPLFQQSVPKLRDADLLFVVGTSLQVHPFASLTALVPASCPRVLINLEPAGDIGTRADDVELLGRCDEVVRDLCRELGWEEELDREWAKTEVLIPVDELAKNVDDDDKNAGAGVAATLSSAIPHGVIASPPTVTKTEIEEARVEAEVATLTEKIGKAFDISERGETKVPATLSPLAESDQEPDKQSTSPLEGTDAMAEKS